MSPHERPARQQVHTGRAERRIQLQPPTDSSVFMPRSAALTGNLPDKTDMATLYGTAYSMPHIRSLATTWCSMTPLGLSLRSKGCCPFFACRPIGWFHLPAPQRKPQQG
jgi:hypothetical protein